MGVNMATLSTAIYGIHSPISFCLSHCTQFSVEQRILIFYRVTQPIIYKRNYPIRPPVCLSVTHCQSWVVSTWLNMSSYRCFSPAAPSLKLWQQISFQHSYNVVLNGSAKCEWDMNNLRSLTNTCVTIYQNLYKIHTSVVKNLVTTVPTSKLSVTLPLMLSVMFTGVFYC